MLWSIENLVLEQAIGNKQKFNGDYPHDVNILRDSCRSEIEKVKRWIYEIKDRHGSNSSVSALLDPVLADYQKGEEELDFYIANKRKEIELILHLVSVTDFP
jgi:hypothetical protein